MNGIEPYGFGAGIGVIDYGGCCTCPTAWWGLYPPSCPVHNPAASTAGTKFVLTAPPPMPAADVERIAQRVAELLKPRRKARK